MKKISDSHNISKILSLFFANFQQKTNRPESVITGYHGGFLVFHPPVVKISAAVRKRHHERRNAFPRAVTKPFRLLPAFTNKDLSLFKSQACSIGFSYFSIKSSYCALRITVILTFFILYTYYRYYKCGFRRIFCTTKQTFQKLRAFFFGLKGCGESDL